MLRTGLSAALVLLLTSAAAAATYHVAPAGSDTGPGTQMKPWATLQHAVDTVAPGDTILVQSGAYAGCRIERSGEKGKPCTLKAAPKAKVVLDRPGPRNRHESVLEVEKYGEVIRHWVIEGFEVVKSPRYGIDLRGTDFITVQRCHVYDSAVTGIVTSKTYHVLIEENDTHHNHEHGIYHANHSDDGVIRANKSHQNDGCGIHMNADRPGREGDGIISRMIVEDNVIWENGKPRGGSAINCDGVWDSIFRNNLCYNNYAGGIALYATDGAAGSSRNKVYNNTIVMAPDSRWVVNIAGGDQERPAAYGNVVYNNVLYSPDANRGTIIVYDPAQAKLVSDYNLVVDRFCATGDEASISLAKWQALGLDRHSRLASPAEVFMDPEKGDYRLRPGSPAIGGGTSLPEVTNDLYGTPRPKTAPDVGAIQSRQS